MKKLSRNSAGFSTVEGLLILVIAALIGFVGWYVWHGKNNTDKAYNAVSSANNTPSVSERKTNNQPASSATAKLKQQYLEVKDWGVKVKIRNPENVIFDEIKNIGGEDVAGSHYDGYAHASFKDGVFKDKRCSLSTGLALYRSSIKNGATGKTVGNYYFWVTGSPAPCGYEPDNPIPKNFSEDFDGTNVFAL